MAAAARRSWGLPQEFARRVAASALRRLDCAMVTTRAELPKFWRRFARPNSAGADPRCGGAPGPFPGGGILTDATLPIGVGGGAMREDALSKAERYREAANRYSELAEQADPRSSSSASADRRSRRQNPAAVTVGVAVPVVRSRCPNEPPRSFTVLEHSIDRARRPRDRKFKPLVLGQIQAAGDTWLRYQWTY